MNKDLVAIFEYLEREKGIKREVIVEAIRESLEIAAQKSVLGAENVSVQVHSKTGEIEIFCDKIVVERVTNPSVQISYKEAVQSFPHCVLGEVLRVAATPKDFGRVAAQKARQVIAQKLRGAERDVIQEEYRHRVNTLVSGTVKKIGRGDCVIVDLGKVEGIMPRRNYPFQEAYEPGQKVLALLSEVRDTEAGGAEVVLSRCSPEFVQQLLVQEIPEVSDPNGPERSEKPVRIEKIVRDPGYRTKMIVRSTNPRVDPVGACIGVRGARVKNIIRELSGEKLDIMPFASDFEEQLALALAPVAARRMEISDDGLTVAIVVDDEDFPTTIGKQGKNVRLLSELLGSIQLTVRKMSDYIKLKAVERAYLAESEDEALDQSLETVEGISRMVIDQFIEAGFLTPRALLLASPEAIAEVPGISVEMADKLLEQIRKQKA